jgi:2-(1,2-epoxy-1,2-dihydrophenyl)acetyl-CoA isomerase
MDTWEPLEDRPTLGLSHRDGAVRVELRRPQALNAFDAELSRELLETVRRLGADDAVRCVLLTGAGRAFSAGADIRSELSDPGARREATEVSLREIFNPMITELRRMPKPVIAAVNGPAAGVGCSIACAADLVIAAESAYFLMAFANIGLTPDGGATLTIPARIGFARASLMMVLAERLPAPEALQWGLIERVVADAHLDQAARDLAVQLAAGPTRSYAATKQALNAASLSGLQAQLGLEARLQGELAESHDFAEGVAAFGARRAPVFTGQA